MDLEKLTDRARGFLQAAQTIAVREHHQRIAPAHLLKALLDDDQGMAAGLIEAAGGDPKAAKREVDALVENGSERVTAMRIEIIGGEEPRHEIKRDVNG